MSSVPAVLARLGPLDPSGYRSSSRNQGLHRRHEGCSKSFLVPFDRLLGTLVGPYRLLGLLAVGGMSRVYVARHVSRGHRAAVKLLAPQLVLDAQSVSRFFHEARAAAEARCPHLVEIYQFVWEPQLQLAGYGMELLHGRDLRTAIATSGALEPGLATMVALQVCRALE